jgi:trk system potassium uptake protein TrkH
MMNPFKKSDAFYLLAFFLIVIAVGTGLLLIPAAWQGDPRSLNDGKSGGLSPIDALFTATSAVCVTGLNTVNTAWFSRFGQIVIMLLIQIGGLGIISINSIIMTIPGNRLAFSRRNIIQGYYIGGLEYNPQRIVRNIIFLTFLIEITGAVMLALFFKDEGTEDWLFQGIFHAVTAFCNAGFSAFETGLTGYGSNGRILSVIMILIVLGGLGFIVLHDLILVMLRRKRFLSYHSRIVLAISAALILGGALAFFVVEQFGMLKGQNAGVGLLQSFFQSITARTAGFSIWPQEAMSPPSKLLTMLLMLIGAAPGSIAGGLKVTTIFVVVIVMFRKKDKDGDIKISHHRLTAETINKAVVYFLKAMALLLFFIIALTISEGTHWTNETALTFEVVSAFSTTGLSLALTPSLPASGKFIIITAMLAGRVGLFALAFPALRQKNYDVTYPEGSVLLG